MKFKKLVIFSAVMLSMPWIGLWVDRYDFVSAFPYGAYEHSAVGLARAAFFLLLIVGFLGLSFGLIKPVLTLWTADASRKVVLVVYGSMFIVAFIVKAEAEYLSGRLYRSQEASIGKVYEQLTVKKPLQDLIAVAKSVDRNITYTLGDSSKYREVAGFPYRWDAMVVRFHYPSLAPWNVVVVQMSADPRRTEAVSEKVMQMTGDQLIQANPRVVSTDVQVYKGHITLRQEGDIISVCGSGDMFLMKMPSEMRARMVASQKNSRGQPIPSFAVFVGVASASEGKVGDASYKGDLTMLEASRYGNAQTNVVGELMMTSDAPGKQQPWGCRN